MRLPDFIRSATFQWAVAIAVAFAMCASLLFGFVYWQTTRYMESRINSLILTELQVIGDVAPSDRLLMVANRLLGDPRRIKSAGLFAANGQRIAGNIVDLPADLKANGLPQTVDIIRQDVDGKERQRIQAAARVLNDGRVLVIGRDIDELNEIGGIVRHALVIGIVPSLLLAVIIGVLLSMRAQQRIDGVSQAAQRIVAGHLRERLTVRGSGDAFDKLAVIVNGMLDEIETLIRQIAGVGDDIAHDLRTPLTRVRAALERGRNNADTLQELQATVDKGIAGLDKSLAIITALLRIAEIEHGKRLSSFGPVNLAEVILEVAELYDPIAEDRGIELDVEAIETIMVQGDRDLLFEALANLVDNALKFTPPEGHVELQLLRLESGAMIRVIDSGPGILESELEAVTRRFYRADKARQTRGIGLGLNLVAAIIELHNLSWEISPGPGCRIEIVFPPQSLNIATRKDA